MKKHQDIPKLIYKKDIFLLILIVFIVTIVFLIRLLPSDISGKKFAEVTVDGSVAIRLELNENDKKSVIPLENGFKTTIISEKGEVWIEECACEQQYCVHMGKISNVGSSIICLPAKTVISIVTEGEQSQTDATTY